jgi:transposase-like protein
LSESLSLKETDMKKSRFSEAQIITALLEQEAGSATAEVRRRHGVSELTFYRWTAQYGGLQVSDEQRLVIRREISVEQLPVHCAITASWALHTDG